MGRRRKSTLSRIANAEAARSAKAPKRQESPEAESNLPSDSDAVVGLQSNLNIMEELEKEGVD
jgi:hypothetical protein